MRRAVGAMLSSSTMWPLRMKRMLRRMAASASAIGRIAVRREEERHVIMLLRRGNAETDRHHIEERRLGQAIAGLEIGTGVEAQLVDSGAERLALQYRRVDPPVGVGLGRGE